MVLDRSSTFPSAVQMKHPMAHKGVFARDAGSLSALAEGVTLYARARYGMAYRGDLEKSVVVLYVLIGPVEPVVAAALLACNAVVVVVLG